jgi:hypothetical protein
VIRASFFKPVKLHLEACIISPMKLRLVKRAAYVLPLVPLILALSQMHVAASPDANRPVTIIRATLGDTGGWEINQFTFLPESGPPDMVALPAGVKLGDASAMNFPMFRARHLVEAEGGLRDGLHDEVIARDRAKRAADIGEYLFCVPLWPFHLLLELPIAGVEKERMLNLEGYTIILPITQPSSIGELPLKYTTSSDAPSDGINNLHLAEPIEGGYDWAGAGLSLHYSVNESAVSIDGNLFPGWTGIEKGEIIIFLKFPAYNRCTIHIGPNMDEQLYSSWMGRYDWKLGNSISVLNRKNSLLAVTEENVPPDGRIEFAVSNGKASVDGNAETMRNDWPGALSLIRNHPYPILIIPGIFLIFIVFHLLNAVTLRIDYRRAFAASIIDPAAVHLIILVIGSIFAPGWLAGTYIAARYLTRRHPGFRRTWLVMAAYALILCVVYEALFLKILWI